MLLKVKTISEAWFYALYNLDDPEVYRQNITRGSFANEGFRLQYPQLAIEIEHPLIDMIPYVPEGVSAPSTMKYVEQYFTDYILGGKLPEKNEEYTYASRIGEQLPKVMEILAETPDTNQAVIEIGRPEDLELPDPACLRVIDFKAYNGELSIGTYWRSNDLWAGFPVNLAGMAKLQEMVAEAANLDVGKMYYMSCGAHAYSYQLEMIEAKISKRFNILRSF